MDFLYLQLGEDGEDAHRNSASSTTLPGRWPPPCRWIASSSRRYFCGEINGLWDFPREFKVYHSLGVAKSLGTKWVNNLCIPVFNLHYPLVFQCLGRAHGISYDIDVNALFSLRGFQVFVGEHLILRQDHFIAWWLLQIISGSPHSLGKISNLTILLFTCIVQPPRW